MGAHKDATSIGAGPLTGQPGNTGVPASRAARRSATRRRSKPRILLAQGLVGAVALTGISGFALAHRSIPVTVDGRQQMARGYAVTVGQLLKANGITVTDRDQVTPAPGAPVPVTGGVTVTTARQLTVSVDGQDKTIWTTASTVDQVLGELGVRGQDVATSASRSSRPATDLRVATKKPIEVVTGAGVIKGETAAETVGGALSDLGVNISDADRTSVPLSTPVVEGMAVVVDQPEYATVTDTTILKHETVEKKDPSAAAGTKKVTQKGRDGAQSVTYRVTTLGGVQVGKEVLAQVITDEPKDEIVTIGTNKAAAAAAAAPAVPAGQSQQIAAEMVKARGWGDDQFSCLVSLWKRESGWRTTAANRSSGAYGIPQALPGSKMAKFGSDWRTNPATQIKWGLSYIAGRYGTPCGAWSAFQSKGWY